MALDTKGPEIRTSTFADESLEDPSTREVPITAGSEVFLHCNASDYEGKADKSEWRGSGEMRCVLYDQGIILYSTT